MPSTIVRSASSPGALLPKSLISMNAAVLRVMCALVQSDNEQNLDEKRSRVHAAVSVP
jgi:hypothetical protein